MFETLYAPTASTVVTQELETQGSSEIQTNLPATSDKPNLTEWLESFLPFRLPRIPLPQTAKNLDKSAARLVDAMSNNVAARVDTSTDRHNALARASSAYIGLGVSQIEDGKDMRVSQRALTYVLNEAKLNQINREAILGIASEELESSPPHTEANAEIADDWLNLFSRYASEKSDADIQNLWGRILAGEIRSPGSVKLRTLSTLSSFDKEDANFTHNFLSQAINGLFLLANLYDGRGNYGDYLRGAELGLVGNRSSITIEVRTGVVEVIYIGSEGIAVYTNEDLSVDFDIYPLTTLGVTLHGYVQNSNPSPRCLDMLTQKFKRDSVTIWKGLKVEGDAGRVGLQSIEKVWPDAVSPPSPEGS